MQVTADESRGPDMDDETGKINVPSVSDASL
jgi:hypothetical protein